MAIRLSSYPVTGTRRKHDRLDLSPRQVAAWLVEDGVGRDPEYCECRLLNLSYAGMCLHGEDLFEVGRHYRFILDLSGVLGSEVEVAARIIWKRPMDAGLCYAGTVFLHSSAPWLGPNEDDESWASAAEGDGGGE